MVEGIESAGPFLDSRQQTGRFLHTLWRFARRKPLGAAGAVILALIIVASVFAPFIAPYDPMDYSQGERLQAPTLPHPFGTDNLGRDILSRVIFGARTSLYIGLGSVILGVLAAAVFGILSGYLGGTFDTLVQQVVDGMMAFPVIMLLMTIVAVFGVGLWNLTVALAICMAPRNIRVIRNAVLEIKSTQYIEAARAIGCSGLRIMTQHILINCFAPITVLITIYLGWAILMEATVSFIGFGVPPPIPSWGRALSDEGRRFMYQAPWIAFFPGLAISLAVFGLNMLGDAVRDVLDPRLRGSQ